MKLKLLSAVAAFLAQGALAQVTTLHCENSSGEEYTAAIDFASGKADLTYLYDTEYPPPGKISGEVARIDPYEEVSATPSIVTLRGLPDQFSFTEIKINRTSLIATQCNRMVEQENSIVQINFEPVCSELQCMLVETRTQF